MKVTVAYDNGRIDVFDDARFTAPQPFGRQAALTNYELRFDALGETGLWMAVHHYDIGSAPEPSDAGETPAATRRRGWRFLLAERGEIEHVESIAADGAELAFRVGGELVDALRFKRMVDLCVPDASRKSKAQCATELFAIVSELPGMSEADPQPAAARFGFGTGALDTAQLISMLSRKPMSEESSGERSSEGKGSSSWMEGFDDEDFD